MATFVMQSLGCEVAALNTVQFSTSTIFIFFLRPPSGVSTNPQQVTILVMAKQQALEPQRKKSQTSTPVSKKHISIPST